MQKLLKSIWLIVFVAIISLTITCCGNSGNNGTDEKVNIPQPLNISVYIDLSDRLMRDNTPQQQVERDTAIINHLIDIYIKDCINNGKIINSKNHFQIFFYPAPKSSDIAQLARGLNMDMSKIEIKQKKAKLKDMKTHFDNNLTQIYNDAINDGKWVGSDIWGFFSNKEVDKLCIRNGYRNILIILTDGYLFHKENKIKEGNRYSYILPQTLKEPESSLIVRRDGLSNLEVLMLEVNPNNPQERDKLISTIEKWLNDMEVGKFVVSETALPVNTEVYIDSFFNN